MQLVDWTAKGFGQYGSGKKFHPFSVHGGNIGERITQGATAANLTLPEALQQQTGMIM